jgi:hypothetical protein
MNLILLKAKERVDCLMIQSELRTLRVKMQSGMIISITTALKFLMITLPSFYAMIIIKNWLEVKSKIFRKGMLI